jgi:hypothetical protein
LLDLLLALTFIIIFLLPEPKQSSLSLLCALTYLSEIFGIAAIGRFRGGRPCCFLKSFAE